MATTEAGLRLFEQLLPVLGEPDAALDVVSAVRDRMAGTPWVNVAAMVARLVPPAIVPPFLTSCPDTRLEEPWHQVFPRP